MNPFPRESKESRDERATEQSEAKRDRHNEKPERTESGKHGIGYIGGDEAPKPYRSEGTAPEKREPGLCDNKNFSRATSFLNESLERGEHSPMVGGHKNDHKTH